MKRYRMSIGDNGAGPSWFSDEDPNGDWVDHEEAEEWRQRALRAEQARDEALAGWRDLFDSECSGDEPEELLRLIREHGVELEYVNGRWRSRPNPGEREE